ncbi:MAG: type II/IV secretion system protein, partial [Planctomycetales bacterium]|nr:type II/IV secretion system protein [Planctomycetales bacterium]
LAQRLVRTICTKCKAKYTPRESVILEAGLTMEQAAKATFMKGKGCNHCQKSGFRGRLGIFELLVINSKVRELIFANANTTELRNFAVKNGMSTLYSDGIDKVMRGITTFEEVNRVAKRSEQDNVCLARLPFDQ